MGVIEISKSISGDIRYNNGMLLESLADIYNTPRRAYTYCLRMKKRILELEPIILQRPIVAYPYAMNIIHGRWPAFEKKYIKSRLNKEVDLDDIDDEFEDVDASVEMYKICFHIK